MAITAVHAAPIAGTIQPELAIISSLGEHIVGNYVLVQITDDSGRVGLGEASVTSVWSGETQKGAIAVIDEVLGPLLVGADPFDLDWIGRRFDKAVFGNSFAKAALEMALLDLQGHTLGVPVYKLLGGRAPDQEGAKGIRLKFVIGAVAPRVAAERALRMVGRGWRAIKVKVGRGPDLRMDVQRLGAVREAVGDTWLSVDANGGYTTADAIEMARHLEKLNVALFEQPTRRGDHAAMAKVRGRSGMPIMADESVFTAEDALELIRQQAADVFSIYPGKHGGIRPTQRIAQLAEAAGIPCTIGSNLEREVATSAMAHVTVATGNIQCERFPGDLIGPLYFERPLTPAALSYEIDRLIVPGGPGLGIQVCAK